MKIRTLALIILLIFCFTSASNVEAIDGGVLGGECAIRGEWVAAGDQHSCWQND